MFRKASSLIPATALLLMFAAAAFGQFTGGSVVGTVVDANGGVVPNATVSLRNKATGQTLNSQTTGEGTYNFPNVPVGDYTITIEGTGFSPATQDLTIVLSQQSTVDATLQAGGVAATVEVTASSEALVQTDSSQLGRSFQSRQVLDLPIFGNQNALALLSPNVVQQGAGIAGAGGSVGGTRPRSNSFIIDGVDNNDPNVTGPLSPVIQDAVSEFSLLTNNFNAEFGTGSGGQFLTITRSGTNEFRGSGFVYTQNQRLNAASTTEERQLQDGDLTEKPRFRDTRFGATIGGPILRNRLFFFGAFERNVQSTEGAANSFLSPTAAGLGQLNSLAANNAVRNILSNFVPANTPSSSDDFPIVRGMPIEVGLVALNVPGNFTNNQFQTNIDYNPNERDQFRFRFSYASFNQIAAGGGNPRFNNLAILDSRAFSASYIRSFNANVINDLRLSYRRGVQDFPLQDPDALNFPNIFVVELGLDLGPTNTLPQSRGTNSYQVYDALTYITGRHNFKVGGEFRRLLANSNFLPRGRGDYIYTTLQQLVEDRVPDFDAIRGVGSSAFTGNQYKFYAFAQDDFRVTPNLTLNLGVRYEYVGIPRDANLQALNVIASVPGVIEFREPKADRNNFAPRVGFAYSPGFDGGIGGFVFGGRGRSSIRGNFGISYNEIFQNLTLLSLPPQFQQELRPDGVPGFNMNPGFLLRGGLPATPIPPTTVEAARGATGSFIQDDVLPYTIAYTLSFQRELTPSTAIELRYLGTRSHKLPVQVQLNGGPVNENALTAPTFFVNPSAGQLAGTESVLPAGQTLPLANITRPARALSSFGFLGAVSSFPAIGNAAYDSGSASITRRFSQGLAFTAAYTFSKLIDDSTNEVFSNLVNPRRAENGFNLRAERGLSANDVPHRFAASFNYEVPRFTDNGFVNFFARGLSINGIFQAQSGQPFTPQSGVDSNLNRDVAGDRTLFNPNGVEGTGSGIFPVDVTGRRLVITDAVGQFVRFVDPGERDPRTAGYATFNPSAQYIQAGPGVRTTAGRNTIRSNGFNSTDMVFLKNFVFGEERYTFQIGAEVLNVFNQRIRTLAGFNATNNSFARIDTPFFNNYDAGEFVGRTVQIRAKFLF